MTLFYEPACIYVELTWLHHTVNCVFAVMSQTEEVQLTACIAQGQETLGHEYEGGISHVERKPAHSYTTLH